VYNPEDRVIEKVEPEYEYEYRIALSTLTSDGPKITSTPSLQKQKIPLSSGGKPIKIKLSYPHSSLTLKSAGNRVGRLMIDTRGIPYTRSTEISISLSGSSELMLTYDGKSYSAKRVTLASDIVSLSSWNRVPLWDTLKRYNDNTFRGKITVMNDEGKLLVVNELPIEDYLK
jgi:hypothetical protein